MLITKYLLAISGGKDAYDKAKRKMGGSFKALMESTCVNPVIPDDGKLWTQVRRAWYLVWLGKFRAAWWDCRVWWRFKS